MWPFIKPIRLIRYLIALRVNTSLVRLPRCLSAELSLVLGTLIANRLPTREAQLWHKALAPWAECGGLAFVGHKKADKVPEATWPVEAVFFAYPGKRYYGSGEPVLWELKLLGDSADHGFFLETFLPALEEAGSMSEPQWRRQHGLWGHFDIQAIYAARGPRWEPFVRDGRLDVQYRPDHDQWADGLSFSTRQERTFDSLIWLTPFDLGGEKQSRTLTRDQVPTLHGILQALIARMSQLLPGKHHAPDDIWKVLDMETRAAFEAVAEQAKRIPIHHAAFNVPPKPWPGRWIGTQTFPSIPHPLIPYLELASILHVGKQTHLGCGTFTIG